MSIATFLTGLTEAETIDLLESHSLGQIGKAIVSIKIDCICEACWELRRELYRWSLFGWWQSKRIQAEAESVGTEGGEGY